MRHWLTLLLTLLLVLPTFAQTQPDARVIEMDDKLRLRAAPSTSASVIALLSPLTPLEIVGVSINRAWLQVQVSDGTLGWVSAEYVEVLVDLDALFPVNTTVRLSDDVIANARAIFQHGQELGNQPDVFAKIGDSITVNTNYLYPLGMGVYDLGEYDYLQAVIDFYRQTPTPNGGNSFSNESVAAVIGWTAYMAVNREAGDKTQCFSLEMPLECEYRLLRPSVALIMFGTNDVSHVNPNDYSYNMRRIVEISIERGVIPVLSTIPMREGYEEYVDLFNQLIIDIAQMYQVPLIDYGAALSSLSDLGLDWDGAHPTAAPRGFEGAADFRQANLYYGYVLRNLTTLQMLDALWRTVIQPAMAA